jgi:hypothetical protein
LDASGKILRECRIDHSGQAIMGFLRDLTGMVSGKPDSVAVAIEVPRAHARDLIGPLRVERGIHASGLL